MLRLQRTLLCCLVLALRFGTVCVTVQAAPRPIELRVDATEAARNLFHVRLTVPAAPGPLTLLYPRWTPGNHGQTGPITNLAGLKLRAGSHPLEWRRDSIDLYAFHCDVPADANAVEVEADILGGEAGGGFEPGTAATSKLAVLNWNTLLFYPQGIPATDLLFTTSLRLPRGWKFGGALRPDNQRGENVTFKPVSLMTLIDSPLIAGLYFRAIPLTTGTGPTHEIDVAGDSEEAIEMPQEMIAAYKRLVAEAIALFGATHYTAYHFLLALSDDMRGVGLEHHESSDNRVGERTLLDEAARKGFADLLPHEYTHSWNGKYRRPSGMATTDYSQPVQTELLWVYEGLTDYLGRILAARAGLSKPEDTRASFAAIAAFLDHSAGKGWRSLADTAVAAPLRRSLPPHWRLSVRGTEYYSESSLIWLEADAILRTQSKGQRSLDDFCRRFFGSVSGPPTVSPYTYEELVAALNEVAPYDWKGFFKARVYDVNPRAPLGGVEMSGWKLIYNETPEASARGGGYAYSLGLQVRADGTIDEVIAGLPADKAGLTPGMKLIAINGRRFSSERLRNAVKRTKAAASPIEVMLQEDDYFKVAKLEVHGGERYPHLERVKEKPDLLSEIMKPRIVPPRK